MKVTKRVRKHTTTAQWFDAKITIPDTNRTIIIWAPGWAGRPFTGNLMNEEWYDFSSRAMDAEPWETRYQIISPRVLAWAEMPPKPEEVT